MRFAKWHGLGNTYLLVERGEAGALTSGAVRRLCDGRTGIGADGVIEVLAVDGARAEIAIWNPDGSPAELSGNGTRIAARWLAGRTGSDEVAVAVGPREVRARMRGGPLVETELGPAEISPLERVEVGPGETVELTPVSVGNPHAVVRHPPERGELLRLGPALEAHPRFSGRTNVQLVQVEGRHTLTVAVWERGAGETPASGTSAAAAAAAAIAHGWCESPVTVRMPGGELLVAVEEGNVTLTGPAQEICRGEAADDFLAELENA